MENESVDSVQAWQDFVELNFIPKALAVGTLGNLINFVILSRFEDFY